MPFYELWEKKTVFMADAGSPPAPIQPPVSPPGIWPGPHPSHPIMLPGMPGWAQPLPPDVKPPTEPPVILPDFASPGFWTQITYPTYTKWGWIQTALNASPDHKPVHPKKGIPGEWISVYNTNIGYTYAWLPTTEEPVAHEHTRKSKESSK